MSTLVGEIEEPPAGSAALLAAKASRLLLIALLAAPVVVFPLSLAYRICAPYVQGAAPAPMPQEVATTDIQPT